MEVIKIKYKISGAFSRFPHSLFLRFGCGSEAAAAKSQK